MPQRNQNKSYKEYDDYWYSFWDKKDIFRTDLPFTEFDQLISVMTPFEIKQRVIVALIAEKIQSLHLKKVLEVGSGAGLNLMLLAPQFPDVEFIGLEPTTSGVNISKSFIESPPSEFEEAHKLGKLSNVKIIRGSILEEIPKEIKENDFDLIYTSAVLEQLHNQINQAFESIFSLSSSYYLFYEEWLEANYLINNYKTLIDSDYFRISWNFLHKYQSVKTKERFIPPLQPSWLKYGVVFLQKIV